MRPSRKALTFNRGYTVKTPIAQALYRIICASCFGLRVTSCIYLRLQLINRHILPFKNAIVSKVQVVLDAQRCQQGKLYGSARGIVNGCDTRYTSKICIDVLPVLQFQFYTLELVLGHSFLIFITRSRDRNSKKNKFTDSQPIM